MKTYFHTLLLLASLPLHAAIVEDVPEPSTIILMGAGLAGIVYYARKKRNR